MAYCCFGKNVRQEKQLLKAIKDNVLELSKEEVEHLKQYLIKKTTQKSLVVASLVKWHDMTTLVMNVEFMVYSIS